MATFPLRIRPAESYRSGGLSFGNDRGSMLHPACDLLAIPGNEIYAVEDGIVIYGPRAFFESGPHVIDQDTGKSVCKPGAKCLMVFDLFVKHRNYIVRYGEIGPAAPRDIFPGATVTEGQHIAHVGHQTVANMLHFEMYSNTEDISYPTDMGNMKYLNFKTTKTYNRRKDLVNPTDYLDSCIEKGNP